MKHHTLGDLTPQDNGQRPTKPRAECERFAAGYKMCMDEMARLGAERDAARAERDRYKAAIVAALYDGDAPMVDTLRTALDAGDALPNVGTSADVPTKAENVGRVALDAGENDNGA